MPVGKLIKIGGTGSGRYKDRGEMNIDLVSWRIKYVRFAGLRV